jgi:hypothetical protein
MVMTLAMQGLIVRQDQSDDDDHRFHTKRLERRLVADVRREQC